MRSVAVVVALAACLHAGLWANFQTTGNAPNVNKSLASVSYAPFEGIRNSDEAPTAAQIRADLKAIAPYTDTIRTYRSTRGMELVPAIAAEFGLKVTLGIGLDTNLDRDGNLRPRPRSRRPRQPRQAHHPQRGGNPHRDQARPQLQQRQRDRGRQRDHAAPLAGRGRARPTRRKRPTTSAEADGQRKYPRLQVGPRERQGHLG